MERLAHVVVAALFEAADAILGLTLGGEKKHRHRAAVLTQLAAHGIAVLVRQHDVEDDELVGAGSRRLEACLAVAGDIGFIALQREVLADAGGQFGRVLDDQDAWGAAHERRPSTVGHTSLNVAPLPRPSL